MKVICDHANKNYCNIKCEHFIEHMEVACECDLDVCTKTMKMVRCIPAIEEFLLEVNESEMTLEQIAVAVLPAIIIKCDFDDPPRHVLAQAAYNFAKAMKDEKKRREEKDR